MRHSRSWFFNTISSGTFKCSSDAPGEKQVRQVARHTDNYSEKENPGAQEEHYGKRPEWEQKRSGTKCS